MALAAPPITVEDYKTLPETGPQYQLVEGSLLKAPAPNRFHQDISRNLGYLIQTHSHPIGLTEKVGWDL